MLALAFLLYETLLTLGGIATTLVRLFVTRKHLLQWTSYAETVRVFAGGVTWQPDAGDDTCQRGALAALIVLFNPAALFVGAAALDRLAAFAGDRLLDQPPDPTTPPIRFPPTSTARLRTPGAAHLALFRTVRRPRRSLAAAGSFSGSAARASSRTAPPPPTWGCCLLSTLAAYDLGYIGLRDLSARLRDTFESMEQARNISRAFFELVRYAHPRAAAAALRVHRG